MRRRLHIIIIINLLCALGVGAGEAEGAAGNFQINTVFMTTSYPLFGTAGQDFLRHTSVGFSLKSAGGEGLHGVIDFTVLFPYIYEEQIYPAKKFSPRSMDLDLLSLDAVLGLGYLVDISPIALLISAGFHTGVFIEGDKNLFAFGVGLDAQTLINFGRVFSAQFGVKLNIDFAGTQKFSSNSNQFAGFPLAAGFYTGIGLNY